MFFGRATVDRKMSLGGAETGFRVTSLGQLFVISTSELYLHLRSCWLFQTHLTCHQNTTQL